MSPAPVPRRIVCGIATTASDDGAISICPPDRHAAKEALELAARTDGECLFVHAVDWLDERFAGDGAEIVEIVERALEPEWQHLGETAGALGVTARHELRQGKPRDELLLAATDWKADVIVVSPRRDDLSPAGRVIHGSTTCRILKDAPFPVWVVQPRTREVRRLLALIDRGESSRSVVDATRMLANVFEAEVSALSCLDYPDDIALHRLPDAHERIREYHREQRRQARDELERLTGGDPKWHLVLGEDWVVREAPRFVAEQQIDLVVLAGTAKPRIAGALLGTIAQKILEHVEVSVWVTRP